MENTLIKLVFYSDKHLERFILPQRSDINIHRTVSVTIVRVLHSNKSSVILPKESLFFPNKGVNAQEMATYPVSSQKIMSRAKKLNLGFLCPRPAVCFLEQTASAIPLL